MAYFLKLKVAMILTYAMSPFLRPISTLEEAMDNALEGESTTTSRRAERIVLPDRDVLAEEDVVGDLYLETLLESDHSVRTKTRETGYRQALGLYVIGLYRYRRYLR